METFKDDDVCKCGHVGKAHRKAVSTNAPITNPCLWHAPKGKERCQCPEFNRPSN